MKTDRLHVGLLSQWFDPEPGPAALTGVYGREFLARNFEVSVLTGFPNYPTGVIYPGHKQALRSKIIHDGMNVTRVPLYPSHDASAFKRVANYVSFAASATMLAGRPFRDVDFIWLYNSPITTGLPLLKHAILPGKPFILHVQDIWPDSILESGMVNRDSYLAKMMESSIRRIVRFLENQAGIIAVISPSVRELILSRNLDVDPAKIIYIPNPTNESMFFPEPEKPNLASQKYPWEQGFSIMYSGSLGHVQGLSTLIDACRYLGDLTDLHIVFVGDGIARQDLEDAASSVEGVKFHFTGRVPMADIPQLSRTANIQLVSLQNHGFLHYTMPSKIPSILAMGLPILGMIGGDAAAVIAESGAGKVTAPGDAENLAGVIRQMYYLSDGQLSSMGLSGRAYYEREMAASIGVSKMVDAIMPLVSKTRL